MANKSTNIEHQITALELMGILVEADDFITGNEILSKYSQLFGLEKNKDEIIIKRSLKTIQLLVKEDLIEARKNRGYRIKPSTKSNSWLYPLLNRYINLAEWRAMDYVFEPLVHLLGRKSLFFLAICRIAKDLKHPLKFYYTNYNKEEKKIKKIQVYALVQRDTKFIVVGKDFQDGKIKNYFLSLMESPVIDFEENLKEVNFDIDKHFEKSLGNYKGEISTPVEIYFSEESKNFIYKEYFQRNAKIEKLNNGYLLKLDAYSSQEVFNIVSKFMDYAELISPEDWRNEYILKLESQLKRQKKLKIIKKK